MMRRNDNQEIAPDEIFLDATNLPAYDTYQFEGRIEKPITFKTIVLVGFVFALIAIGYATRVWALQIQNGKEYSDLAENNRLDHTIIFADRGIIYDRNHVPIAWNEAKTETDFNLRQYIQKDGFAHLLGYIKYPKKDSSGFYYSTEAEGVSGIEKEYNTMLGGTNGLQLIEINALNEHESENTIRNPKHGESLVTSIDSRVQSALYKTIKDVAEEVGFVGGGGLLMDLETGELIAMTSYPEFSPQVLTDGTSTAMINEYIQSESKPFINRLTTPYTPGSILKPIMALGALTEGVITPDTVIVSNGSISIPNRYDPDNPSIFNDWKAHGPLTVRSAIANSSNVFFYEVGGGFGNIKGLGIARIEKYVREFGYGENLQESFLKGHVGTIPNPEWKEKNFDGDPWRLGDTYFTAIGQYGFQATPLQVLRAMGTIANKGTMVEPTILKRDKPVVSSVIKDIPEKYFTIVHEGMRQGAIEGTARALNVSYTTFAGKTGTAELGISKAKVNSWVTGFFPYENPRYAFVIVMEKGGRANLIGAAAAARRFFDWMNIYTPEYFKV